MGLNYEHTKENRDDAIAYARLNFSQDDITVYLAYTDEHLPHDNSAASDNFSNYIKRVRRLWSKNTGHEEKEFKYFGVTEVSPKGRLHHHIIFSAGISPDQIIEKWKLGDVEAKPLFNDAGIPEIMQHITKPRRSYRKFTCSQNLELLGANE